MTVGAQIISNFSISSEEYSVDPVDVTLSAGIDEAGESVNSPSVVFVDFEHYGKVFTVSKRERVWVVE